MQNKVKDIHLTSEELKEIFEYDAEKGILTNKYNRGIARKGERVGAKRIDGYIKLSVGGKLYLMHRVIFKMMKGRDAKTQLFHIDRNSTNNRIENLEEREGRVG